ncbi:MAG: hypothetical protein Q8Q12_09030 [bacterium]|nr:hypothetical protein [bacterium]
MMTIRRLLIACIFLCTVAPFLHAEFDEYDFSTPDNVGDLVFNFFHHSSGGNLLDDGLQATLQNLGYTLHSRISEQYVYENNFTDYRHWYKRFQRELGVKIGDKYYRYAGPGVTPTQEITANSFMLTWYEFRADRMDIIMFKPCYPGSAVSDYDTVYDAQGNVIAGTPHSDNGINNFVYLNSGESVDDGYTDTHWSHGDWWGADSSLAQLKVAYRGMLNIFAGHPDLLFIAMQAPPMCYLSDEEANNCREFARWLREDWLHEYDPTGTDTFQDYPLTNVCAFDWHNAIAWTGNDAVLDSQYTWFPVGGFPDNTLDTTDPGELGRNAGEEDHPEPWLNQRTTVILCGGTDTFSQSHTGKPQRLYYSWINAVVNRWRSGALPPPRPVIERVGNSVSLTWDAFGSGQYTVQWANDLLVGPWQAATGTWPTTETVWAGEEISGLGSRYFRVRSE